MRTLVAPLLAWVAASAWLSWPQDPAPTALASSPASAPVIAVASAAPQGARVQGAKVTFARTDGDGRTTTHSTRARLLSLAVERGETATPFVAPGLFRATYQAVLVLPARERCRFRVEGRGTVKLLVNGEAVLAGVLRGKPIDTADVVKLKKGDNELRLEFESQAMGDGQFRLFWSGADFGFEPLTPERLSWAADDADIRAGEQLRQGQQLFTDRRCATCHDFPEKRIGESAFGELDRGGPDLRTIGARVQTPWLAAWLRDPRALRADATMPQFALSDAETKDLAAYLATLGGPMQAPAFAADDAAKGQQRFRQLGCVACHAHGDDRPDDPALAMRIPLAHVPQKWHTAALVDYLRDPSANYRHVRMPDLKLSLDDARQITAWLLSGTASPLPAVQGDAKNGKKLAQQHRCGLCHELEVPLDERPWPRFRNLKPERGCLADKPHDHKAPSHQFTPEQRAAVRAFLPFAEEAPFRRAPLDFAQRHLVADRCTSCHALDGQPSTWARWAAIAGQKEPLPKDQDPVAQGVPALTWAGGKLQPSWLARFVTGQEKSPRPWLTARMPAFEHHGATITAGLVREHGYGDKDEPPGGADAQLTIHGERLLQQGTGFGCVQCHALGDKPAVQVFEREGIELLTARARLRHEYYTRWLANPPRLDPDARMPKYADDKGKTAFGEVLGGDAAKQFEAIWQYLGSRRADAR